MNVVEEQMKIVDKVREPLVSKEDNNQKLKRVLNRLYILAAAMMHSGNITLSRQISTINQQLGEDHSVNNIDSICFQCILEILQSINVIIEAERAEVKGHSYLLQVLASIISVSFSTVQQATPAPEEETLEHEQATPAPEKEILGVIEILEQEIKDLKSYSKIVEAETLGQEVEELKSPDKIVTKRLLQEKLLIVETILKYLQKISLL